MPLHAIVDDIQNNTYTAATATGTNSYAITLNPAITAYALYQTFYVLFTNANTGAATLNVNGLGAKNILRNGNKPIKEGDILAGQVFSLMYDGTNFQIIGRVTTDWSPPFLSLGDIVTSGVGLVVAGAGGYYANFDNNANDTLFFNIGLQKGSVPYDGSDIQLQVNWMAAGAISAGNEVEFQFDYFFGENGLNADSVANRTRLTGAIDLTGRNPQELYTDNFGTFSGNAGATHLQCTLTRLGTADSYAGTAELYGINLITG
jgi:hypothetical protein